MPVRALARVNLAAIERNAAVLRSRLGGAAALCAVGRDGSERQTAEDLARRIDTLNYEIVCGITGRVPRVYQHDGDPVEP